MVGKNEWISKKDWKDAIIARKKGTLTQNKRSGWIMDTGKIIDNYKFFEGFEGEPEIVIEAENTNMPILHIWDGYLDDILREPSLEGEGWHGFTRDYHQCEGVFGDDSETIITDISEYLDDLKMYKKRHFDYDETREVFDLLCSWLENALENGHNRILVKVV